MDVILKIVDLLLDVAFMLVFAQVVMSWLVGFDVLNVRQPVVYRIWSGLNRLLEPVYGPIRRFLPDMRPLDLSPLVVILGIVIVRTIVLPELAGAF